jgi:hypothetical protein
VKQMIFGVAGRLFWERPGTQRNFTDHVARLEGTADEIVTRAQGAQPTDRNREWLVHLVGIERWGQRRLQVGFGDPYIAEEYDGYRPALDAPWPDLIAQFQETRAETVALARRYAANEGDTEVQINHNDFGGLTPGGWLEYLRVHAALTVKLIR